MKKPSKVIIPLAAVAIIALVIAMAGNFSQKPTIYVKADIQVAEELRQHATELSTMFIILHDSQSPSPRPYGATREKITVPADGKLGTFVLTPERVQIMNPGGPIPKSFRLKVRLDRDGQGGPDQPGDIVGELNNIRYGSSNVTLTLRKRI